MNILHTVHDGCKVRGVVKGCAVGFQNHAGRNFLGIGIFLHIHYEGAFAFVGIAFLLHVFHHAGNDVMDIAFPFP